MYIRVKYVDYVNFIEFIWFSLCKYVLKCCRDGVFFGMFIECSSDIFFLCDGDCFVDVVSVFFGGVMYIFNGCCVY